MPVIHQILCHAGPHVPKAYEAYLQQRDQPHIQSDCGGMQAKLRVMPHTPVNTSVSTV